MTKLLVRSSPLMLFFKPIYFILIFFFFFSSATPSLSSEPLNPEVLALIAIRDSLVDSRGVMSNWDEDSVDPCAWTMITCSFENVVTVLGAASMNLSGTLSPAIGNLTNLQQVLFQNNNISGEIPSELGKLPKLKTLDLSNNSFRGHVPDSLGQLTNLQYLRLNNNSLSGVLPESLAEIPGLVFLDLSYNNLSGPVPKVPARAFNIEGNLLICGSNSTQNCSITIAPDIPVNTITSQGKSRNPKAATVFGVALGSTLAVITALGFVIWWKKKQNAQIIQDDYEHSHDEEMLCLGNLKKFNYRELQIATDNFSSKRILGKGGFGNVYKGFLQDGTVIAVKRLKDFGRSGEKQFQTEIEMISLALHRNLLRLLGFCITPTERLLVYPFMSNGSVASRLRSKPSLDWNTRKSIALGAARGLVYLHEQCDPKIIHRDVKAANILLDDYCEAVVGDFGLAKLMDHRDSHVTTAVRGTVGHIAPEYLSTGQSSEKTDVFGFGILLLELITGQKALDFGNKAANQKGAMLDWVKKIHQEKKLDLLVDKDLRNSYDRIEVGEMVQVALLCTQYLPSRRPKMSEVVKMLEGDGLAHRWEASQENYVHVDVDHLNIDFKKKKKKKGNPKKPERTNSQSDDARMIVTGDDDDDEEEENEDERSSPETEAMELSGPR